MEDKLHVRTNAGKETAKFCKLIKVGAIAKADMASFIPDNVPEWFRKAGCLYCPVTLSAGSALLNFPSPPLHYFLRDFTELPQLLSEVEPLGCNLLYLLDYWEGDGKLPVYLQWVNKGDYKPRADLGGERAFRKGIEGLHQRGARLIVYVEPFIIWHYSEAGKKLARDMAMTDKDGIPYYPYLFYWALCPGYTPTREYIANVCKKLVKDYDVDGIHLDSYGIQKDWACYNPKHDHPMGSKEVFNEGAVALIKTVRDAIRSVKKDAIVMIEGCELIPTLKYADGTQDWGLKQILQKELWPYGSHFNIFSTSSDINDINHLLAMGKKISIYPHLLKKRLGDLDSFWEALQIHNADFHMGKNYMLGRLKIISYLQEILKLNNIQSPEIDKGLYNLSFISVLNMGNEEHNLIRKRAIRDYQSIKNVLANVKFEELFTPFDHLKIMHDKRARVADKFGRITYISAPETKELLAFLFKNEDSLLLSLVNTSLNDKVTRIELPLELLREEGIKEFIDPYTNEIFSTQDEAAGYMTINIDRLSLRYLVAQKRCH